MASSQDESPNQLVWFITGCSTGFGNQFVTSALARGDKVIATARPGSIAKLNHLKESLDTHVRERYKVMELDVTSSEEVIENVARDAVSIWGRVDVVVNNAA
jgi:NAD(P)-dependent dehydrogenase (short-subunit alcohol dehydrogenase family)